MNFKHVLFVVGCLLGYCSSSRVLELSDKFTELSGDGQWFVKFYAPWCAHCRRMEPVWAHVAQALYRSPLRVAKVDCTRFPAVTTHFKIRSYPTILFIKGQYQHEYTGDRSKDEMVNYALRMSQPAVQTLSETESLEDLKSVHSLFFGYLGKEEGPLWEAFWAHAEKYQPHNWFYSLPREARAGLAAPDTAVFVYRDDEPRFFEAPPHVITDRAALNASIDKWVMRERHGLFPRVTHANIEPLLLTDKYLVLVVVDENRLSEITQTEKDFRSMVEDIVRHKKRDLQHRFQFGWTGSVELANQVAMTELSTPHLLVLNSTTRHHHLPEDEPVHMTQEAVLMFLERVHLQQAPTYGGGGLLTRLYRGAWGARTALASMWRGNPVLTTLVFGLPLGFLSLICYSVCCADILDADEEEEEDTHEKTD